MTNEDMNELGSVELDAVVGGKRHFAPEKERPGWLQHKVGPADTLIRIANNYHIPDWRKIREWNPHINHHTNQLFTGEYLWIKEM